MKKIVLYAGSFLSLICLIFVATYSLYTPFKLWTLYQQSQYLGPVQDFAINEENFTKLEKENYAVFPPLIDKRIGFVNSYKTIQEINLEIDSLYLKLILHDQPGYTMIIELPEDGSISQKIF